MHGKCIDEAWERPMSTVRRPKQPYEASILRVCSFTGIARGRRRREGAISVTSYVVRGVVGIAPLVPASNCMVSVYPSTGG